MCKDKKKINYCFVLLLFTLLVFVFYLPITKTYAAERNMDSEITQTDSDSVEIEKNEYNECEENNIILNEIEVEEEEEDDEDEDFCDLDNQETISQSAVFTDDENESIIQSPETQDSLTLSTKNDDMNIAIAGDTLTKGSSGAEVLALHRFLIEYGYLSDEYQNIDIYDDNTMAAVSIFQAYHGLSMPDGLTGKWTRKVINETPNAFSPIEFGESSVRSKWVQSLLRIDGYLCVDPDGIWGKKSQKAIETLNLYISDGEMYDSAVTIESLILLFNSDNISINLSGRYTVGDTNQMIQKIRAKLYIAGFSPDYVVSSLFDEELENQIRLYQLYGGITPDGIVGSWSIRNLNQGGRCFNCIKRGDSGKTIEILQNELFTIGALEATPDGKFGTCTYNALCCIQKAFGFSQTGIFDLKTGLQMFNAERWIKSKSIMFGNTGQAVSEVQEKLFKLGYFDVAYAPNVFDQATFDAVVLFQVYNGLVSPDGIFGQWSRKHLLFSPISFYSLKKGMNNSAVNYAQQLLNPIGLIAARPDSSFGNQTAGAIQYIQTMMGADQIEYIDMNCWKNIRSVYHIAKENKINFSKVYEYGHTGAAILYVQSRLIDLGYAVFVADGIFGNQTEGSVISFRLNNGLGKEGIIDKIVLAKLIGNTVNPFTPYSYGNENDYILEMQKRLQKRGFLSVAPDGIFGNYTLQAIRDFQSYINVECTGIADAQTTTYLFSRLFSVLDGIDVSEFQGSIDWESVANAGIKFAIIRVGGRYGQSGKIYSDEYYVRNITNAKKYGIRVGVYFFSQAINESEAIEEADYICAIADQYNITMPIVIDTEYLTNGRANALSTQSRTTIIKAFCNRVVDKGYEAMIYSNVNWLENNLYMNQLSAYRVWVAHYTNLSKPEYSGTYSFWQYTSNGSVPGINGRVDMNYWYV